MKFDELYWHDSIIKKIEIDRSNPGVSDTIRTEVRASEKINSWSRYYRKVKHSKWAVIVGILSVLGIAFIAYRYVRM